MKSLAWTATALATAGAVHFAVTNPRSQVFGQSVYQGSSGRRSLALTFDDGPSPGSERLAAYLAEQDIRATFFQCGLNVERHPHVSHALARAGHEIGNHTYGHRRLSPRLGWKLNLLSARVIYRELSRTQRAILNATGQQPTLFRAPYGLRWLGLGAAQQRLRLTGVMWTAMAHDWEWNAARVTRHIIASARPGAIICMHDGRDTRERPDISTTLTAIKAIVPRLRDLGYSFETVSELLRPQPPTRSALPGAQAL